MYWWIPMAAGAVLGAVKNASDNAQAESANKESQELAAVKELWSPFTGQHGNFQRVGFQSPLKDIGEGAISGWAMGQDMESKDAARKLLAQRNSSSSAIDSKGGIDGLPRNNWAQFDDEFDDYLISGPRRKNGGL